MGKYREDFFFSIPIPKINFYVHVLIYGIAHVCKHMCVCVQLYKTHPYCVRKRKMCMKKKMQYRNISRSRIQVLILSQFFFLASNVHNIPPSDKIYIRKKNNNKKRRRKNICNTVHSLNSISVLYLVLCTVELGNLNQISKNMLRFASIQLHIFQPNCENQMLITRICCSYQSFHFIFHFLLVMDWS